ncbi:MAG: metallophosphoesterase family protein, partial [Lachnospiraceae bacterium]|nr:metallophosphoesterase family protein [Lachnospiraceae bacterium]
MKLAVMSDIHGNYIALQKCLEFALSQSVENFLFLGDYHGELAYPQRTMDILYALREKYSCYFIRGNKEDYWKSYKQCGEKGWEYQNSTTGSLLYTYENLTETDFAFLTTLPAVQTIAFPNLPAITACHGSPRKANEKMLPGVTATYDLMEQDTNSLILCGHTHVQGEIEHTGKRLLNPGSVGVPLHSDGKTQFLILHGSDGTWHPEFLSLNYDVEQIISDLYKEGLHIKAPFWCKITKNLLRTGEVAHGAVLARAMELCL